MQYNKKHIMELHPSDHTSKEKAAMVAAVVAAAVAATVTAAALPDPCHSSTTQHRHPKTETVSLSVYYSPPSIPNVFSLHLFN